MAHEFILSRISNDFRTAIEISEIEIAQEPTNSEFKFETESNSYHSIEVNINSKWENLIWYSPKSKRLFQNSKYFQANPNMIEYLKRFSNKMKTIIFGDEGELYFIPSYGQIQNGDFFNQEVITVMELAEHGININDKDGIKNYIINKIRST